MKAIKETTTIVAIKQVKLESFKKGRKFTKPKSTIMDRRTCSERLRRRIDKGEENL